MRYLVCLFLLFAVSVQAEEGITISYRFCEEGDSFCEMGIGTESDPRDKPAKVKEDEKKVKIDYNWTIPERGKSILIKDIDEDYKFETLKESNRQVLETE